MRWNRGFEFLVAAFFAAQSRVIRRHCFRHTFDDVDRLAAVSLITYKTRAGSPSSLPLSLPITLITHNGFHLFRHLQGELFIRGTLINIQPAHFRPPPRSCTSSSPFEPESVHLTFFASFAVIIPPLGVFLERGCGADFCINILLVRHHSPTLLLSQFG